MKKVLIGMLLIIPVLVILIVSATASIVQGAYIAVESVELYMPDESGFKIKKAEDMILAYISDVGIQLEAIVHPTRATNKDVVWTIENENVRLGVNVLTVDSSGYVSYHGLGSADVVVTAEGNIKARCRILVTSPDVMSISISNNLPETFKVGGRHQLEATLTPADVTTSQRYLVWSVESGKDKASIDQNGILTAKSAGSVTVRATLKNPPESLDADKCYAEFTFIVKENSPDAVFTTEKVTMNGVGCDLSELLNSNYSGEDFTLHTDHGILGGVDNNYLSNVDYDGKNAVTVNITAKVAGSTVDSIKIVFKQIFFLNEDMWSELSDGSNKNYLTLNSAGVYLDVKTNLKNIELLSSNTKVAKIENGYLVPQNVGETTVIARKGDVIESFVVKVLPPVYEVELHYNNADDEMGVAMSRVFGKKTFANGKLTNTLAMEIGSIYTVVDGENKILTAPKDIANYLYLLDFEVDSASKSKGFSVSESGTLTIGSSNSATVKLKAKYPLYESIEVSSSYNFKFIENGVNIGVITKAQRELWKNQNKTTREIEDSINVIALQGFDYVNAQAKAQYDATGKHNHFAMVLHSGVVMNKTEKNLYCSLYGNGNYLRQTREDEYAFFSEQTNAVLKVVVDNITIENTIIRATRALEEGESLYDYVHGGNGIVVDGRDKYFQNGASGVDRLKNITINYVIVENAYYCIYTAAADVNIHGAIMRNSGAQSLYVNTSVQDVGSGTDKKIMNANVTISNCVFSNAINMSIGIITEDLDSGYDENETVIVDGKSVTRPKYISYFEKVTKSVLNIEGFCEIYNWKTSKELDFSFVEEHGIDEEMADLIGITVRNLIDNDWDTLSSMLNNIDLNQFMCEVDGVRYYQLAIGNVGVHYPMSGYIPDEDKQAIGLTGIVEMDISAFQSMAPGSHIKYPLAFYCYDTKNPAVSPVDKCVVDSTLFKRMRNAE